MGVSSSESHDLTAFYEMLSASFGVLSQNTGFYPSLDRIIETMLGPLNLGPGGGSYNEPISCLHRPSLPAILEDFFHHKPALVASFILWLEYLLCAHHTHFPIFQLPGTHVDPLFCQPGPFTACAPPHAPFCAPLHTPAHLRAPLHTFVLHLSWACHPYLTFL